MVLLKHYDNLIQGHYTILAIILFQFEYFLF
jgi:hypothetical protein